MGHHYSHHSEALKMMQWTYDSQLAVGHLKHIDFQVDWSKKKNTRHPFTTGGTSVTPFFMYTKVIFLSMRDDRLCR